MKPHSIFLLGLTALACSLPACNTSSAPPQIAVAPAPVSAASTPVSSRKKTSEADRDNKASIVPYPFTTCAVIRKDLEGSPKYRRVYKNQEVIFCCTPCLKTFDANPEPFMGRIFAASAAVARGETVNSGW